MHLKKKKKKKIPCALQDVTSGFVLCSPDNVCHTARVFDAQIVIMEHESIICAGYSAVMHIHTSAEEVAIKVRIPAT